MVRTARAVKIVCGFFVFVVLVQLFLDDESSATVTRDTTLMVDTQSQNIRTRNATVAHPTDSSGVKKLIIYSYARSGTTLSGELFNQNPDAFYLFEVLDSFWTNLLGLGYLSNTEDLTSTKQAIYREPDANEIAALTVFLEQVNI